MHRRQLAFKRLQRDCHGIFAGAAALGHLDDGASNLAEPDQVAVALGRTVGAYHLCCLPAVVRRRITVVQLPVRTVSLVNGRDFFRRTVYDVPRKTVAAAVPLAVPQQKSVTTRGSSSIIHERYS